MKKGQVAVPVALILFIILFVFYIIWVQPIERQRLLNPEGVVEEGEEGAELGENDLFRVTGVGWVGKGIGEPVYSKNFGSMSLDYPLVVNSLESTPQLRLTASLFRSGTYTKSLDFSDSNLEKISLSFETGTVSGTPKINIYLDNNEVFSESAVRGQVVSLDFEDDDYNGTVDLRIECGYSGLAFWETQVCGLNNFKIREHSYQGNVEQVSREFFLSSGELVDGTAKISFKVTNSQTNGTLSIRLNEVLAYNGKPAARSTKYSAEVSTAAGGLSVGPNTLQARTSAGGVYDLEGVELSLIESETGAVRHEVYYNVPRSVYEEANNFTVEYELANMASRGGLEFVFRQVTKYESYTGLRTGFNSFTIPKSEVSVGSNKLIITSQEGRFNIDGVRMFWN